MLLRLSQIRAGVQTRIFVTALALVLMCTCLPLTVFARDDLPKPHVQPGDGDGPAGVQDAVPADNHKHDSIRLWIVPDSQSIDVVVVNVVLWKVFVTLTIARR